MSMEQLFFMKSWFLLCKKITPIFLQKCLLQFQSILEYIFFEIFQTILTPNKETALDTKKNVIFHLKIATHV